MEEDQKNYEGWWQVFHPKNINPIGVFEIKSVAEQFIATQPFPEQYALIQSNIRAKKPVVKQKMPCFHNRIDKHGKKYTILA